MSTPDKVRALLAKYRDHPAPPLNYCFPAALQLDADACGSISNELSRYGAGWERLIATRELHQNIPAKCGLYMFSFHSKIHLRLAAKENSYTPSWILYVGRAGNATSKATLRDRYKNEYSKYVDSNVDMLWDKHINNKRKDLLAKYLSIYPIEYWYCVIEERDRIDMLERRLIRYLSPPLNTQLKSRIRILDPTPAFRSP